MQARFDFKPENTPLHYKIELLIEAVKNQFYEKMSYVFKKQRSLQKQSNMKYLLSWCYLLLSFTLIAQPTVADEPEEEIFQVVQEMPMFPGCTDSTGTAKELKACADQKMLEFVYANINYPEVDRLKGNEGTVVARFVVEKDGSISNPTLLRNRGERLGQEALRVINMMNELPEKWTPGKQEGEPVRVYFNLPVKFKIQEIEEPDFMMVGQDSVWVHFDTPAQYKSGDEDLVSYIDQNLQYPAEGQDSCRIGIVEVNFMIQEDGFIKIIDVVDYSDLGIDYQFEAIRVVNSTGGDWTAAVFGDRKVNTNKSARITFRPNMVSCGTVISDFEAADRLADEASIILQEEQLEEGIAKLTEAINMFPDNGEYLSMRGQAYLKLQKTDEACLDLKKARDILVVSWYDSLIPLLCK